MCSDEIINITTHIPHNGENFGRSFALCLLRLSKLHGKWIFLKVDYSSCARLKMYYVYTIRFPFPESNNSLQLRTTNVAI